MVDRLTGRVPTIDGREAGPASMREDAFVNPATGQPYAFQEARVSGISAGVPGTPDTWSEALRRWGTRSLAASPAPATGVAQPADIQRGGPTNCGPSPTRSPANTATPGPSCGCLCHVRTYDSTRCALVCASGRSQHVTSTARTMRLIVASELATNAIRHGGGTGRLRLWHRDGILFCQVSDHGPGIGDPTTAGTAPPDPAQVDGGRGLWICRHLTADLRIEPGPDGHGAIVTAAIPGRDAHSD
jgi:anti-sigma regulatory factor (Ser/Thr protein kinase)